jgi:hypothetical protein
LGSESQEENDDSNPKVSCRNKRGDPSVTPTDPRLWSWLSLPLPCREWRPGNEVGHTREKWVPKNPGRDSGIFLLYFLYLGILFLASYTRSLRVVSIEISNDALRNPVCPCFSPQLWTPAVQGRDGLNLSSTSALLLDSSVTLGK